MMCRMPVLEGPGRMALGHWDLELSRVSVMHSQVKRNKYSIFCKAGMAHSSKLASGFRKFIFIETSLLYLDVLCCAIRVLAYLEPMLSRMIRRQWDTKSAGFLAMRVWRSI